MGGVIDIANVCSKGRGGVDGGILILSCSCYRVSVERNKPARLQSLVSTVCACVRNIT